MVLPSWFYVMPQTFVPLTATRNDKTKWMNLLLRRWGRLDLSVQRTFWFRVESRYWCVGQLVFAMPQTFVPLTATRNDKTKWINLLLEKIESPGSQRTAVILVLGGVTLLVCALVQLVFPMPHTFLPPTETQNDKTKWMNLFLEKVGSPGFQRTAVILG